MIYPMADLMDFRIYVILCIHMYNYIQYICTYGYGSIPIDTVCQGTNIHKSKLFWCEQKRDPRSCFDPSSNLHLHLHLCLCQYLYLYLYLYLYIHITGTWESHRFKQVKQHRDTGGELMAAVWNGQDIAHGGWSAIHLQFKISYSRIHIVYPSVT